MSVPPSRNDPARVARESDGHGASGAQAAEPVHTGSSHDSGSGAVSDRTVSDRSGSDRSGSGSGAVSGSGVNAHSGANTARTDRQSVVAREKERYGGIKWGSAFFGWLTATGTAVLLTSLLVAAGVAVGAATDTAATDAQNQATRNAGTIGLVGGLTLLAVLLISYYCGGYVAGRMARFNGAKQGVAVWIWALLIAAVVAVAVLVLGDQYNVLDRVGGFPRLPVGGGNATTGSIVALVIALVAALIGAVLGGLAGMRFHRKVDKAGLGH